MNRPWLAPFTPLYAFGLALRNLRIEKAPVNSLRFPVVSIGNLSTGGSGKTPLTIALARALTSRGLQVDVLSRGYGRSSKLPAQVLPHGTAEEFGDEPLLIAREANVPVYVAPQRYQAGLLAESALAIAERSIHLLDDGFQHRQLFRSVDILLIDRRDWHDALLPAGNLREPLHAARRASVIAIPADEPALEPELRTWGWQGPLWRLRRKMEIPALHGPVVAFCGIARPAQFFQGLASAGTQLAARVVFPDHHRYTAADLQRLVSKARSTQATALLTTQKDQVRMGHLAATLSETLPLEAAGLRIVIVDEDIAINWLLDRLHNPSAHG